METVVIFKMNNDTIQSHQVCNLDDSCESHSIAFLLNNYINVMETNHRRARIVDYVYHTNNEHEVTINSPEEYQNCMLQAIINKSC